MDRWKDADDDTALPGQQGRVARLGMQGFVKSQVIGTEGAQGFGKIEVVQSKKEQKAAKDVQAMPPPPPPPRFDAPAAPAPTAASAAAPQPGAPPPLPPYNPPPWASDPIPGACLEVLKEGHVVSVIHLDKVATVFGRHPSADVVLDHPSSSRQHASICFQGSTGKCMVIDLGSAHGTFVDGRKLDKNVPVELKVGSELRFAASSRQYVYSIQKLRRESEDASGKPNKRARVSFGDDGDGDRDKLEQVIGYSDGGDFAARVGPRPSDQGQFAGAVVTTIIPSSKQSAASVSASSAPSTAAAAADDDESQAPKCLEKEKHPSKLGTATVATEATPEQPDVKPEFRNFVDQLRKEPSRQLLSELYQQLPPPSNTG